MGPMIQLTYMITTGWSDRKKIFVFLGLIGFAFFYGSSFARARINKAQNEKSANARLDDIKVVKFSPNPTLEPSPTPSFLPTLEPSPTPSFLPESTLEPSPTPSLPKPVPEIVEEIDPYDAMVAIGKDVTDNSNVSVFKNKDGSIDVINNIQLTPEVNIGWGFDASTRKWITEFLTKSYTSDLKIRYVLVTVSFLNTGRPATRAGLGVNQASKYSETEWNSFTPYDLCTWLKQTQIGDNVDSSSSSFNPSNWAFAKNYTCD